MVVVKEVYRTEIIIGSSAVRGALRAQPVYEQTKIKSPIMKMKYRLFPIYAETKRVSYLGNRSKFFFKSVKIKETYDNWDEITKSEKQLELFTIYRAHNGFESDPN